MLEAKEMALIAAKALDAKKGKDIRVLQIDKITTLADYFVLCTGASNTQINALCDEVEKELTAVGEEPLHREGYRGGTWVLLDYGCIAVHVFSSEARQFYSLEHVWADGKEVDLSGVLSED
jgi:ribosome-associated protein